MTEWKVFVANGSALVLQEELNQIEQSGWEVFQIDHIPPQTFRNGCELAWAIIAKKD